MKNESIYKLISFNLIEIEIMSNMIQKYIKDNLLDLSALTGYNLCLLSQDLSNFVVTLKELVHNKIEKESDINLLKMYIEFINEYTPNLIDYLIDMLYNSFHSSEIMQYSSVYNKLNNHNTSYLCNSESFDDFYNFDYYDIEKLLNEL